MGNMIGVHWIPTHRGGEDAQTFARWNPAYVKIVCIDERPPYLEDVPAGATIIIRNHPMSELYGERGFQDAAPDTSELTLEERYTAYFADWAAKDKAAKDADPTNPLARAPRGVALGAPAAGMRSLRDPIAHAQQHGIEHADACERMAQYCESKGVARSRLVFEGINEPMLWSVEPPPLVAAYYLAFLLRLHEHGLHGVVGCFGVGWPGNGGVTDAPPEWAFFKPVIEAMRAGDYLGLHEYWALNGPLENWRWWGGRFLQCPYRVPILITECGIDLGVLGQGHAYGGWHDLPGSYDEKARQYASELSWYVQQCAADGRVQGITPFTYDI